jgi:hypothetical protein
MSRQEKDTHKLYEIYDTEQRHEVQVDFPDQPSAFLFRKCSTGDGGGVDCCRVGDVS